MAAQRPRQADEVDGKLRRSRALQSDGEVDGVRGSADFPEDDAF